MSELDQSGPVGIVLYVPTLNSIGALIGRDSHDPCCRITVGGETFTPMAVSVDMGFDSISSSAQVQLPAGVLAGDHFNGALKIEMGYKDDDGTENYGVWPLDGTVFNGFVEDDDVSYFPWGRGLKGAGWMRRAQYPFAGELVSGKRVDWHPDPMNDEDLVKALLTFAGIPANQQDINGETDPDLKIGVITPIEVKVGDSLSDLIGEIDGLLGYRTYDSRDGVVHRRLVDRQPTGSPVYSFAEGDNILSISRPRSIKRVKNQVKVEGAEVRLSKYKATWQATSSYVPAGAGFITEQISSDHVESYEMARVVAQRRMPQVCRLVEELSVEVPGNPSLVPGKIVEITAASVGIASPTNFFLRHINHTFGPEGFFTRLTLEGGTGEAGARSNMAPFALADPHPIPEPGGLTFTIEVNGSASYDDDWYNDKLSYAWTDTATGAIGRPNGANQGIYLLTGVTPAMISQSFSVSLTVTDVDGAASAPYTVEIDTSTMSGAMVAQQLPPATGRKLYVAAGGRAEASIDSGATWRTWTPSSGNIISTPPFAPPGYSLFGSTDGSIYWTGDSLASTPELVGLLPDAVLSLWIHQSITPRVLAGCRDGRVYLCQNIDVSPQTWEGGPDLGGPVNAVWHDATTFLMRACAGADVMETADFVTWVSRATWAAGRPLAMAHSPYGTYFAGDGAPTIRNLTTDMVLPDLLPEVADVRAIAVDWTKDRVLAMDTLGRLMEMEGSSGTFASLVQLGAPVGLTGNMLPEPGVADGFWAATDSYILYSGDGGRGWTSVRNYAGITGVGGLQMGLAVSGTGGIAPTVVYSVPTAGYGYQLGALESEPADWYLPSFSGQWSQTGAETPEALAAMAAAFQEIAGASWFCATPGDVGDNALTLFRYTVQLPEGTVASATLRLQADDAIEGVWVGGQLVHAGDSPRTPASPYPYYSISVPRAALNPGGGTVIAFKVRNVGLGPTGAQFKLEVS